MAVVVGVADSVRGHVQLGEAEQWDSRLMDSVDETVARRVRHCVDQLLGPTRGVRREQDVGV